MAESPDHYDVITEGGVTRVGIRYHREIVHACPPRGSSVMPCCGLMPFEVPRTDRMTVTGVVTCATRSQPGNDTARKDEG